MKKSIVVLGIVLADFAFCVPPSQAQPLTREEAATCKRNEINQICCYVRVRTLTGHTKQWVCKSSW